MSYLNDIETLKYLMNSVYDGLIHLSFENFEENFPIVLNKSKKARKLRELIIKNHPPELVKKNEEELQFLAKQIKIAFDNVVKKYQDESSITLQELKVLTNNKKLANYNR